MQCRLHFVFHGCGGNPVSFAKKYNELAALNNIIMVYPDTRCWDSSPDGIDPENYMTNYGIVPRAIKAMIARLTGTENGDGDGDGDDNNNDGEGDGDGEGNGDGEEDGDGEE